MTSIGAQAGGLLKDMFQVISPGACSVLAVGVSSVPLPLPSQGVTILRLFSTVDCFVSFGSSPTASVEGATSMFLPSGVVEYFERKETETLAVITATAQPGKLYVTEGSTQ